MKIIVLKPHGTSWKVTEYQWKAGERTQVGTRREGCRWESIGTSGLHI